MQPVPRLAVVTADNKQRLVSGNLAKIIEALLDEEQLIEICGDKLYAEINCAGGQPVLSIGKRGITPKK